LAPFRGVGTHVAPPDDVERALRSGPADQPLREPLLPELRGLVQLHGSDENRSLSRPTSSGMKLIGASREGRLISKKTSEVVKEIIFRFTVILNERFIHDFDNV